MRVRAVIGLVAATLALTGCATLDRMLTTFHEPLVSQGTGFLVRPDGLVLTAFHVVRDSSTIKVRCQGYEAAVPAKLGAHSGTLDLAVLETPLSNTPYLSAAEPRSAKSGDQVFVMGFPSALDLGPEPKFSEGVISALSGSGRDALLMLFTAPIQPGSSGGPVMALDGSLVGIVTGSEDPKRWMKESSTVPQNLNWAVKADYVTPLYDRPSPRPPATSRSEAIERASQVVCIVLAAP
jgi:serine protease Do